MRLHGMHSVSTAIVAHSGQFAQFWGVGIGEVSGGHVHLGHVVRIARLLLRTQYRPVQKDSYESRGHESFAHPGSLPVFITLKERSCFCNRREVTEGYGSNCQWKPW